MDQNRNIESIELGQEEADEDPETGKKRVAAAIMKEYNEVIAKLKPKSTEGLSMFEKIKLIKEKIHQ